MKNSIFKKLLISAVLLTSTYSFANGPQGNRGAPPAEAITACEGQSEGVSCSVTTPRGDTLDGTCKNTPDGKYFVCMPANMENNRPPQNR